MFSEKYIIITNTIDYSFENYAENNLLLSYSIS